MVTLPERLRALRNIADISARASDRLAGLHEGHTRHIELGRWSPGPKTAAALAHVFGASLDWLVSGAGRAPSAKRVRDAVARARSVRRGVAASMQTAHKTSAERKDDR